MGKGGPPWVRGTLWVRGTPWIRWDRGCGAGTAAGPGQGLRAPGQATHSAASRPVTHRMPFPTGQTTAETPPRSPESSELTVTKESPTAGVQAARQVRQGTARAGVGRAGRGAGRDRSALGPSTPGKSAPGTHAHTRGLSRSVSRPRPRRQSHAVSPTRPHTHPTSHPNPAQGRSSRISLLLDAGRHVLAQRVRDRLRRRGTRSPQDWAAPGTPGVGILLKPKQRGARATGVTGRSSQGNLQAPVAQPGCPRSSPLCPDPPAARPQMSFQKQLSYSTSKRQNPLQGTTPCTKHEAFSLVQTGPLRFSLPHFLFPPHGGNKRKFVG